MAILLIEVPFKVAGRWREYTSRVRPWWAAGEGESSKVQEMYLSKRAEKKIHVHKLPSCTWIGVIIQVLDGNKSQHSTGSFT